MTRQAPQVANSRGCSSNERSTPGQILLGDQKIRFAAGSGKDSGCPCRERDPASHGRWDSIADARYWAALLELKLGGWRARIGGFLQSCDQGKRKRGELIWIRVEEAEEERLIKLVEVRKRYQPVRDPPLRDQVGRFRQA
jgi:hypothetical protein